jgi:hypothetical protein
MGKKEEARNLEERDELKGKKSYGEINQKGPQLESLSAG